MNLDPDFIDLEPEASDQLSPLKENSKSQERQIKERQQDIKILAEVLTDLRFNQLTNTMEYGPRTEPIQLKGDDLEQLTVRLAVEHGVFIPESRVKAAVKYAASQNSFCPIKRYLMDCVYRNEQCTIWDSLGKYMIGSDQPIATLAFQRFFIGAVARAYDPGCSFSWMPIFIGPQGCGKSQLIRELIPKDLFAEMSVNIDLLCKEIYRLHVAWLIELPEVDNYFNVKNIENFKNLITTRVDEVRLPYQALPQSLNRRFVLAGTSNRSEIFVDPTGNRRFLPLEIAEGFETPWRTLHEVRHTIWARAVQEFQKGTQWEMTSGEIAELHQYIQQFNVSDPWEDLILKFIENRKETTTTEILIQALSFNPQAVSVRDSKRVAAILTQLGWRRQITSRNGKSVRLWKAAKSNPTAPKGLTDF